MLFSSTVQQVKGFRCAIDVSGTSLGADAHLTRAEWDHVLKGIGQIGNITSDSGSALEKELERVVNGLNSQHAAERLTFQSSVEKKVLGKHKVKIILRVHEEEDETPVVSRSGTTRSAAPTPEQSARGGTRLFEESQPTIVRARTENTIRSPGAIRAAEARPVMMTSVRSLPQMVAGSSAVVDLGVASCDRIDTRRNVGSASLRCAYSI